MELYLTDQNYIHFVSFIFLPGPLHRDSHKPVQVLKNFFKGPNRVEFTISLYTMDIEHVFKNNVTMDNVQNISQKRTVWQKNSAFSVLYTWEYLSIHDVQVLILTEYFEIFCKFGEIKYKIQQQLLTYLQSP